jgi:hypothetical protein
MEGNRKRKVTSRPLGKKREKKKTNWFDNRLQYEFLLKEYGSLINFEYHIYRRK